MKKYKWKIEYSITLVVIFAVVLLLLPSRFVAPKEASYISEWNNIYHKMEYVFSAMNAQADSEIIRGFNKAKTNQEREKFMMNMVKPYLRINYQNGTAKHYDIYYMNSMKVLPDEEFYFENIYDVSGSHTVGIKDVKDDDIYHPAFIMMFDVNGSKSPNTWGKDIFGMNIFIDGKISPLGAGLLPDVLKEDCSSGGSGVFCSYYYRIGGDFIE
jgi:hypothetical protein